MVSRRLFGKASNELMLPDCFGFPASLPSILSHAGLKGFSTQKLSALWQPAQVVGGPDSQEKAPAGIPFNVGRWVGPDGMSIIAALNPGSYTSNVYTDLSQDPDWVNRIQLNGKVTGVFCRLPLCGHRRHRRGDQRVYSQAYRGHRHQE